MKHFIYKTINKINNKFYIGVHSSNNINDSYLGSGIALKQAIKKYGRNNFKKEVLFYFDSKQEAYFKESEIVNETFINRIDTYNEALGGLGGKLKTIPWNKGKKIKGHPHTEESKRKISESRKGKLHSEETKRKLSEINKGKKHSEETKEKLRISSTGRLHTKETKEKIRSSKTNKDVPWRSKLVGQYTLAGKLIKVYKSGRSAAKAVNVSYTSIQDCCNNKRISVANYIWKYGTHFEQTIPSVEHIKRNPKGIKKHVKQYDLNGNLIKKWDSAVEAAKTLNPDNIKSLASGIRGVCNKKCKTCGGFIWKYTK